MEYNGCNYFSFWAIFCAFPLLTNQDMKISKNWKKQKEKNLEISSTAWRLSKYSVSSGPYSPTFGLNTERYLSIFPFSVWMRENTDQKNLLILTFCRQWLFNTSVPKIMIICYVIPMIWCVMDVIVTFCPFTSPESPKNEKNSREYHYFTKVCNNLNNMLYCSWYMVHNGRTDRWKERRKKWHKEVGYVKVSW